MSIVLGHRGHSAHHLENSMEAFRSALEVGMDGFELDAQPSQDGVCCVLHDDDLGRTARQGGVLRRLKAEGWKISMATGKSRRGVESVLRMHGWAELFESTHCPEDSAGKPDPLMLIHAMQALEATPVQTVMIGDTNHDMRMAVAAGVRAQGVAWGFQTPDEVSQGGAHHVAHTWAELDEQLDRFAERVRAAS